jgi:phosphate uptake regulator
MDDTSVALSDLNASDQLSSLVDMSLGKLREILESNRELAQRILELESRYDEQFSEVFQAIRELMSERAVPRRRIIGLSSGGI